MVFCCGVVPGPTLSHDQADGKFRVPTRLKGMTKKETKPWKKEPPNKSSHTKLTAQSKAKARAAAKKSGRPYPNLVDNMKAAKKQKAAKGKS